MEGSFEEKEQDGGSGRDLGGSSGDEGPEKSPISVVNERALAGEAIVPVFLYWRAILAQGGEHEDSSDRWHRKLLERPRPQGRLLDTWTAQFQST